MEQKQNHFIIASAILGFSLIVGVLVGGFFVYQIRAADTTVVVTGSAKEQATSDTVKWSASFSRTVGINDLKLGYVQMKQDSQLVEAFLRQQGVSAQEFGISPVSFQEPFKYDSNAPRQYVLTQWVTVNSSDVSKVTEVTKQTETLINQGVIFSTNSIEYFYSKLPELRLQLVAKAIDDGKARASVIAEKSDRTLGAIKSVSMGVVQVLAPNSIDVSDYGTYDTSTITKEVMMTVKLVVRVK